LRASVTWKSNAGLMPQVSSVKVSSLGSEWSRGTDGASRDVDGAKVRGETPKPVSCLDAMPAGAYNRTGDNWRPLFANCADGRRRLAGAGRFCGPTLANDPRQAGEREVDGVGTGLTD
jgi:hypothetical protein